MNITDILTEWLQERGYDGLYLDMGDNEACGCWLCDLMPCGSPVLSRREGGCQAAYVHRDGLLYPGPEPAE